MGWFGLAVRTLLLDPKGPAKGPAWFGLAGGAPIRNPGGSGLGLSDEFAYLPWGAPSPGVPWYAWEPPRLVVED